MKKLLGIVILGLLLSGNAYAKDKHLDKLKKLGESYKSGLITKEIFESSKKRILKNFHNQITKKVEKKKVDKKEEKFPTLLLPANSNKRAEWKRYINYKGQKIWAEVRTKNSQSYRYQWEGRYNLESAFNAAMDQCELRKKKFLNTFKNSEICIVMLVNNKETTDKQKIEYAEKYYGKEIARKSFALNKNILKNQKTYITKKKPKKVEKKKEETKKVTKKYELKGERSIALSWEGYEDLIAGTVKFDETDYRGTLNLSLPNNDGVCDGTYSLQEGGKGTWQIACSNNMGAAGTLKWGKDGGVTGTGRDYNDKKVKFTVSKNS